MLTDSKTGMEGLGLALFHRPEPSKLFMILTAYLDASGNHKGAPVFVLAGRVGRQGKWWTLERQWKKELKSTGTTFYHTKEIRAGVGEYRGWKDDAKQSHIDRLSGIAGRNTMFGFTVVINVADFNKYYLNADKPRRVRPDSLYSLCFRIVLVFIPEYIRNTGIENPSLHIVQEQGDRGMADCARILDLFRRGAPEDVRDMIKSRTEGAKKEFPGLQAADLLAGGVYQNEQTGVEASPISREEDLGSLRHEGGIAPVVRLKVTPETLGELRDHMFLQMDARRADYLSRRGAR